MNLRSKATFLSTPSPGTADLHKLYQVNNTYKSIFGQISQQLNLYSWRIFFFKRLYFKAKSLRSAVTSPVRVQIYLSPISPSAHHKMVPAVVIIGHGFVIRGNHKSRIAVWKQRRGQGLRPDGIVNSLSSLSIDKEATLTFRRKCATCHIPSVTFISLVMLVRQPVQGEKARCGLGHDAGGKAEGGLGAENSEVFGLKAEFKCFSEDGVVGTTHENSKNTGGLSIYDVW